MSLNQAAYFVQTYHHHHHTMAQVSSTYSGYRLVGQGNFDCLVFVEGQKTPQVEPHQCLIKVHAVSLNVSRHTQA